MAHPLNDPLGSEITAYVTDVTGAIMCPICDLEMAAHPTSYVYYCGSGYFGDGHFISARNVQIPN